MRLDDVRDSDNVEDQRGSGLTLRRGAVGGGTLVVALVLALLGAPRSLIQSLLNGGGGGEVTQQEPRPIDPAQAPQKAFVTKILAETEDVWGQIFQQEHAQYERPHLVLFSDAIQSGCGGAESAMGPFYCPLDHKVYLDLSFFQELARRFGAPGEFAQAYVVAHEVGHHVQTLTGVSDKITSLRQRAGEAGSNQLSVQLELQADCLAGVWANHSDRLHHTLEPGDIEAGLRAASAIGDDTLQKQARGYVVPESFTHGTSAQRVQWFKRGYDTGDLHQCATSQATKI